MSSHQDPTKRIELLKAADAEVSQGELGDETNVVFIKKPSYGEISIVNKGTHYVIAYTDNSATQAAIEEFKNSVRFSASESILEAQNVSRPQKKVKNLTVHLQTYLKEPKELKIIRSIWVFNSIGNMIIAIAIAFAYFYLGTTVANRTYYSEDILKTWDQWNIPAHIFLLIFGFGRGSFEVPTYTRGFVGNTLYLWNQWSTSAHILLIVFGLGVGTIGVIQFVKIMDWHYLHLKTFVLPILSSIFILGAIFVLMSSPIDLGAHPQPAIVYILVSIVLVGVAIGCSQKANVKQWITQDVRIYAFEDGCIEKGFIQGGSVRCANCGYVFLQKNPDRCVCGSEQLVYDYPKKEKI